MIGVKSKWTRTAFLDKHLAHRAIEGGENDFVFYSLGVNDDCKATEGTMQLKLLQE